ncbi:MAG: hypothetical protein KC656_00800 [Myxococcales bacterium]|nr:hypothetical protein [Myxococcales bacterium]MCB9668954.1 hypothetical protein [Alphaproteobacteria bacterium]MCB9691281.1 hypothetical protein [Alphaproteobacteria bacterium]
MQRRALAAYQTVAAVGIGAWWIYWFASGSNTHGTACALRYENGFPVADLTLAGVLAGSALDLARGRQRAWILGPLAAGMAFSLATLDTSHNLVTGGFAHSALRKVVFAAVNGSVGALTLVWLHRNGTSLGDRPSLPPWMGEPLARGTALFLPLAVLASIRGDGCGGALAVPMLTVGLLIVGLGRAVIAGRGPVWALVTAGAALHATLVAVLQIVLR